MNFLHSEATVGPDNSFVVSLSAQANVKLLDDCNFQNYKAGRKHKYQGGLAKRSPVRLSPPHFGVWHIVVDMGGYSGRVRANIDVV